MQRIDTRELSWVRGMGKNGSARALREAARITLREAARALNVDASVLSRWERGQRLPSPRLARRWAALLREWGA